MKRGLMITGAGVVSPAGSGRRSAFDGLLAGRSKVRAIERFDASRFKSQVAAPIEAAPFVRDVADRHAAYAVAAAEEALSEGGLLGDLDGCVATGLVFATAIGATEAMEWGYRGIVPLRAESFHFDSPCQTIAQRFGLGGPVLTSTTGCTASLDALGLAFDLINAGFSERMLIVTGEAPIVPIALAAFDRIHAVSRCPDPAMASRPFALGRDGFVLGEGGAAMILESEGSARRRGATVCARLMGWASVSSGYHMTAIRTDGSDLVRAMRACLKSADCCERMVDAFDLHGTSTRMNDLAEARAIASLLGAANVRPAVAQKSINGHALGASNLIELVNAISSFERSMLPPAPLTAELDPECGVDLVSEPRPWRGRTILKLSSGFSGIHSAALLGAA